MSELAERELKIRILGDSKSAEQAFASVEGKAGGLGSSLGKMGLLAGAAFAGLGAGALGAAGAGIKVAADFQQTTIAFNTMLGSASKAKEFLGNLRTFAAATPFEFPELATAASSLISVGVNANDVIPIMKTLGNATAGMGTGSEGVKRATVALQQMSAAGRITGEDLNRLRDAGIPVFDLLAAATGKTKEQVAALAQSGKLGKKELDQLFEALKSGKGLERFNGLMDAQSKTLNGVISTLKDTLSGIAIDFITPYLPAMTSALNSFASFVQGKLVPGLRTFISDVGKIKNGISDFVGGFTKGTDDVGSAQNKWAVWGATFSDLWLNRVLPVVKAARSFIKGDTAGAGVSIGRIFGFEEDSSQTDKIISVLDHTRLAITKTVDAVRNLVKGNTAGAGVSIGRIFGFEEDSKQTDKIIRALDSIKHAITGLIGYFRSIAPQVQEAAANLFNKVKIAIEVVVGIMIGLWRLFGDDLLSVMRVAWNLIKETVSAALEIVKGVIQVGLAIINGDWGKAWDGFKQILGGVWDAMFGILRAGWDTIKVIFSGAWDQLKGTWQGIWDAAKDAVGAMLRGIGEWFHELPTAIKNAVGDLSKVLTGAGKDLVQGLIDGINGKSTDLWKNLASLGGGAGAVLSNAIERKSPSKMTMRIGHDFTRGFALGISGKQDEVHAAAANLGGGALANLRSSSPIGAGLKSLFGGNYSPDAGPINYQKIYNVQAPGAYAQPITEDGLVMLLRRTEAFYG